jgi:hypothetical protein
VALLAWMCGFLAIAAAVEGLGLFAHEFNAALAITLSVLYLLIPSSGGDDRGRAATAEPGRAADDADPSFLALLLIAVGLVMTPTTVALRPFALATFFGGCHWWASSRGRVHPTAAALAVTSLMFGAYYYLFTHSVQTWYAVNDLAHACSEWVRARWVEQSDLKLEQFPLGPTYAGVHLLVLALAGMLGQMVTARRWYVGVPAGLVGMAVMVLAMGGYLVLFVQTMPDPLLPSRVEQMSMWQHVVYAINPVYMPAVLGCGLAVIGGLWALLNSSQRSFSSASDLVPVGAGLVLAVAAVGALLNLPGEPREGQGSGGAIRAVLWKDGFHNWMTPTYERFGARSGGMFGNLPMTMASLGWEAEVVDVLDEAAFANTDVLFIANQKDPLPELTQTRIEQFVRDGGSLLVLGDHTWKKGDTDRMILDDTIRATNINYNFDTAYYFIGGWLHSMQYFPHPTTAELGDSTNESGCVAGASLRVEYPAVPLVIGKHGYADRGTDDRSKGYMDNGKADLGEALGDLVLVAAQNVDQGRVVVVGDTSGFVNGIQVQTWDFTTRLMRWLASTGQAVVPAWRESLGIGALVLLGFLALVSARKAAAIALMGLVALAAGWGGDELLRRAAHPEPMRGEIAYIDLAHNGWHSLEAWRDNAISGVYLNLMRNGYQAIGAKHFDIEQVRESELFVTIAPTEPYSATEIRQLEDYLQDGGTMLLCVGWEEMAGAQALLDHFEMKIPHEPLGRASDVVPGTQLTPQFWEAWPVRSTSSASLETIASLWQQPIIVQKAVGQGKLVMIGDTKFLFCQNLEGENSYNQANVDFLRWLITTVLKADPA